MEDHFESVPVTEPTHWGLRVFQLSLLLSLVFVAMFYHRLIPLEEDLEHIPIQYWSVGQITLAYEGQEKTENGTIATVRLLNPTGETVTYSGYSRRGPWYRIQTKTDKGWKEYEVGWFCGTGLGARTVPSSASCSIPVDLPRINGTCRVGLEFVTADAPKKPKLVWTRGIVVKANPAKAKRN